MKTLLDEILEIINHENNCRCIKCVRNPKDKTSLNKGLLINEILFEQEINKIPPVHLTKSVEVKRSGSPSGYRLNEPGQPSIKDPMICHNSNSQTLLNIVDYLDVEKSNRYKATPSKTYCNIYAYDYCTFAGAYLPKVWWTNTALKMLRKGENVIPKLGDTLSAFSANYQFNWLSEYGGEFYWKEMKPIGNDFSEIQETANNGNVVVLTYKNSNGSGHILAIIPESDKGWAKRSNSKVILPVHSQAGRVNFSYNDYDPKSSRNKTSLFNAVVAGSSNVKIYRNLINC